jgi:hypothetical protein
MAVDKLVDSTLLDAACTYEAGKIREKLGSSAQIAYDLANGKGFGDAIAAIPTGGGGGSMQSGTITFSTKTAEPVFPIDGAVSHFIYYYEDFPNGVLSAGWHSVCGLIINNNASSLSRYNNDNYYSWVTNRTFSITNTQVTMNLNYAIPAGVTIKYVGW